MTFLEAIDTINEALTELRLKDAWGTPLEGIEALGAVAKHHGEMWDQVIDDMDAGRITPKEYCDRCLALIDEYARHRFAARIDRRLGDLVLDQRELS